MNSFTLNFKDIDLEWEWRLKEINRRKAILFVITAYRLFSDVVFNVIMQESATNVLIFRFSLDFVQIFSCYMIYYTKQSKKSKDILREFEEDGESKFSNWELIKFKIQLQLES
jgi:hypothetical protein